MDRPESNVVPEQAPVQPRMLSPSSEVAQPLIDKVVELIRAASDGVIAIVGPPLAGKTTAIRHIAGELAGGPSVILLDDPPSYLLDDTAMHDLVVCTAPSPLKSHVFRVVANLPLAPWTDDDLIEYLLATAPNRCSSVMPRILGCDRRDELQGRPGLWTSAIGEMLDDPQVDPIAALYRHVERHARDERTFDRLMRQCSAGPGRSGGLQRAQFSLSDDATTDRRLAQMVSVPAIRDEVIARWVAGAASREDPTGGFEYAWPGTAIERAAALVREDRKLIRLLKRHLKSIRSSRAAGIASLLFAVDPAWRPRGSRPLNLARGHFPAAKWRRCALAGARLAGANLTSADLTDANLEQANLAGARLTSATLHGAAMTGASLESAVLSCADLSAVRASSVPFTRTSLRRCNLSGAILNEASFVDADLRQADLSRAELNEADLREAQVDEADFSRALLRGANLSERDLRTCRFDGASLRRAKLWSCNLEHISIRGVDLYAANLSRALLTGARLRHADLFGANLNEAGLAHVDLEGADLRCVNFTHASFHLGSSRSGLVDSPIACEGSRTGFYTDEYLEQSFREPEEIRKANLCGVNLHGAIIEDTDFYLVDLRGAKCDPSQIEHLRRCGAILEARV